MNIERKIKDLEARIARLEGGEPLVKGQEIDLKTSNGAELRATFTGVFKVKTCHLIEGTPKEWSFGRKDLRETADWFNMLADKLEAQYD